MRALRACLTTGLMLLATLLNTSLPAHATDMTWNFTNNTSDEVHLRFYSEDLSRVWPENGKVYFITPYDSRRISLACDYTGQKICYGAAQSGSTNIYWGIGLKGSQGCESCCAVCDDYSDPQGINLNLD